MAGSMKLDEGACWLVGWMDGEAPERAWADSNLLAYSTREMGPGSRRDTIDDSFGHWNWAKVTELGECFIQITFPSYVRD